MVATDVTGTTIHDVILLSHPRPEAVAVLVVLPAGSRLVVHFLDDDTSRDITEIAADLLAEYLLRGQDAAAGPDVIEVARIELVGGTLEGVRLATIDQRSAAVGEVPSQRLLPLLGAAVAMAVADAVAQERSAEHMPEHDQGSADGDVAEA
jgi:hypothetical protein